MILHANKNTCKAFNVDQPSTPQRPVLAAKPGKLTTASSRLLSPKLTLGRWMPWCQLLLVMFFGLVVMMAGSENGRPGFFFFGGIKKLYIFVMNSMCLWVSLLLLRCFHIIFDYLHCDIGREWQASALSLCSICRASVITQLCPRRCDISRIDDTRSIPTKSNLSVTKRIQ